VTIKFVLWFVVLLPGSLKENRGLGAVAGVDPGVEHCSQTYSHLDFWTYVTCWGRGEMVLGISQACGFARLWIFSVPKSGKVIGMFCVFK